MVEQKLKDLGLVLPEPFRIPEGVRLPFVNVRRVGKHCYISGHAPQNADGSLAGPFGKVGREVSKQEAYQLARLTALSVLASLKRELGSLESITWCRVFGMVNAADGFTETPFVINGFSDLILELYGAEHGSHSRSAIGVAALPFNFAVEVEAEIELH